MGKTPYLLPHFEIGPMTWEGTQRRRVFSVDWLRWGMLVPLWKVKDDAR